jgi:hypothetical protein
MGSPALLILSLVLCACRGNDEHVLYAWDRPERLDGMPAGAEVAVYTATVSLARGTLLWRPRAHPLRLPERARITAVIHFETARADLRRPLDDALASWLVDRMAREAERPGVSGLQIDYEAPLSERPFLRALVVGVRRALGSSVRLSMTALASWCLFDDWLGDLPVDEVVPMVYRDPPPALAPGRRIFYFAPHSWTADDLARMR